MAKQDVKKSYESWILTKIGTQLTTFEDESSQIIKFICFLIVNDSCCEDGLDDVIQMIRPDSGMLLLKRGWQHNHNSLIEMMMIL